MRAGEALQALSRPGVVVAGFPANDFAGQEPGTNEEIQTFCTTNFGVEFPLFDKIAVVAPTSIRSTRLIAAQPKAVSVSDCAVERKAQGLRHRAQPGTVLCCWNICTEVAWVSPGVAWESSSRSWRRQRSAP